MLLLGLVGSDLTGALLLALGGILGVLVGGRMNRSRERWRWQMDARLRVYTSFLRSLNEFRDAGEAYDRFCTQRLPFDELEVKWEDVARAITRLHYTFDELDLLGSVAVRKAADDLDSIAADVDLSDGPDDFQARWEKDSSAHSGHSWEVIDLFEVYVVAVRRELAFDRWRFWRREAWPKESEPSQPA
jgi:hypothetical protein